MAQNAEKLGAGVSLLCHFILIRCLRGIEHPWLLQIRVLGFTRVTKSFEARRLCDRRRYEYILPAFAFDPACCRGAEAPLAHVGAAGNIVEKHAGGELDLEAALKALPGPRDGSEAQSAAGKLEERQEGEVRHESGGALQDGIDASGKADSLSAQPGSGLQPIDLAEERAHASAPGGTSAKPHMSIDGQSSQPPGTQHESREEQHHSSNGRSDTQAEHHKQQHCTGLKDQRTGESTSGRSLHSRHTAGYHIPEHYKSIKFTKEQEARLSKLLSNYEGTHNFHNYTVRVAPDDPAAMRYILSFKCEGTMEIQVCCQGSLLEICY